MLLLILIVAFPSCKENSTEPKQNKVITLSTDRAEYHFSITNFLQDTIWLTLSNTTDKYIDRWFPDRLDYLSDTGWVMLAYKDGTCSNPHVYTGQQLRTFTYFDDDTLVHQYNDGTYRITIPYTVDTSSQILQISSNSFMLNHLK